MSTIEKALGLLEHFSTMRPEVGLSEFKRLTGYDKGTLHRYLTSLRDCGFLEQVPATKAYRLGPAVIRLSTVREKTVPLIAVASAEMSRVAQETQELAHSALPQAKGMSTLFATDGGNAGTRVAFDEAEILPFHATSSGIAMLAYGAPDLAKRALAEELKVFTKDTVQDPSIVTDMIADAICNGFATTHQTFETEVSSVSVPFYGPDPFAMGTVAIATPSHRMTDQMQARAARILGAASLRMSETLGGRVPPDLADKWAAI